MLPVRPSQFDASPSVYRAKTQLLKVVPASLKTHVRGRAAPPEVPPAEPPEAPPAEPPPEAPAEPPLLEPPDVPPLAPPAVAPPEAPAVPPAVPELMGRHTRAEQVSPFPQSESSAHDLPFRSGEGPSNREHAELRPTKMTAQRFNRNTARVGWCCTEADTAAGLPVPATTAHTRRHCWSSTQCSQSSSVSSRRIRHCNRNSSSVPQRSTTPNR